MINSCWGVFMTKVSEMTEFEKIHHGAFLGAFNFFMARPGNIEVVEEATGLKVSCRAGFSAALHYFKNEVWGEDEVINLTAILRDR